MGLEFCCGHLQVAILGFSSLNQSPGNNSPSPVSNSAEDAHTSHPCESGAGLLSATTGGWCRLEVCFERQSERCVMKLDTARVPENSIGSLTSCLIEGDPLQQRRARNIRRRAIFFSVIFQSITVAALIILPLLGKGERIPTKIFVPIPPYRL